MTMVSQNALEQGYEKMCRLPHEKLVLVLEIIDQFSDSPSQSKPVQLGIADGKYHVPEDINQYDDDIATLLGVQL